MGLDTVVPRGLYCPERRPRAPALGPSSYPGLKRSRFAWMRLRETSPMVPKAPIPLMTSVSITTYAILDCGLSKYVITINYTCFPVLFTRG